MKVIALNIRHGGGNRIKSIVPILVQSKADIIVLTEFRFNNNSNIVRNLFDRQISLFLENAFGKNHYFGIIKMEKYQII